MRFRTAAVAAAALAVLALPTPAHAEPGDSITLPVSQALANLSISEEDRTGYERDAFKHWIDADKDGCSTRNEVLLDEAVEAPDRTGRCTLTGGTWYSPYDDRTIEGPRGLDIDHRVPLAESWDSGASAWSAAEREAYANDLGDHRSLIAVSASSNRSKADQDPSTWMPPAEANWCEYARDWVAVKTRWGLSIDVSEEAALSESLSRCPDEEITVTLAR
ncbi:HNH endonuclease family protein [Streptomyces sp. TOR3209]|uniref:HNH endonuclease family protein n=1 Tax=Streptomyces sp. TOR3209 TaxID=1073567 RepID=UPI0004941F8F|nr:HNH endonuclease family protein [Streptomyces sp. TOR3209]